MTVMNGVRLPGDSTVQHVKVDVPEPGHGQVLLRMKASSICGSDIRAVYREHLGAGPEAYQGVIAGHEPCGQVVAVGPTAGGCSRAIAWSCTTSPAAASARSAAPTT
jgi:threonine dehydrogenase-like Zn-dependent dehydrogenase